ncbi:MAG: polysaccharide deacetylase family protein [Candidatus Wildermuthbacteria bacterium]|nr:polysaccharide deacetylase family protein [Candidatus Wildermuthbacteria bacterium]
MQRQRHVSYKKKNMRTKTLSQIYFASGIILLLLFVGFLWFVFVNTPRNQEPNPSPTPTHTLTPTPQPSVLPTPSPTPAATASPSPSPSIAPFPSPVVVLPEIVRGNTANNQVILTFDGGAGVHSGQKILEVLQKHSIKGTFFVTGSWADQNSSLLGQISRQGHEVFNHTYTHPHLTQLSDSQIADEFRKAETAISTATGKTTKPYFRPPYGDRNARVLQAAAKEGYRSVYWTIDALDWKENITAKEVKDRIVNNLANGSIFLMHIGDDITGQILDEVIVEIKSRGYAIVSLTEGLK